MEEKALTVDSMSEKLESQATDVERESDSKKDLESLAGVDEKAGPKATEETEHDPNIVDWDGEVCCLTLRRMFCRVGLTVVAYCRKILRIH